jgi:hypothetical protein
MTSDGILIIATNEYGSTRMTSDGILILESGATVDSIVVKDGRRCDNVSRRTQYRVVHAFVKNMHHFLLFLFKKL